MGSYSVLVGRRAERDLRRLPTDIARRALTAIRSLEADPISRQSEKLAGSSTEYRLRVGSYRVLYEVDHQARTVHVHRVRHRREAYR